MQTYLRKYGVQATIDFVLYDTTGASLKTDAAFAAGDLTMMATEGTEGAPTNGFADEGMGYSLTLTAAEMQAARIVVYVVDQGTKAWLDTALLIETYGHASAQHVFDLGSATVTVGSNNDKTGYGLANDAITAAKFDESTAFPLKSADGGATAVLRTGADGDTGETLSDQLDAVKAKTDAIGAVSVAVASPVVNSHILENIVQGDDYTVADSTQWDFTYTGLPYSLVGATSVKLRMVQGTRTVLELTGAVLSAAALRFQPTAAQTASLPVGSLAFEVEVTLATGVHTPTPLNVGRATVRQQAV